MKEQLPKGNETNGKFTIYDVARRAGVGIGTVSRVINDSKQVTETTRERVLTAIRELGYSPDPIARSLNSGKTNTLGVIVPFFTRPFFIAVLEGIQTEVAAQGYDLVLYNVVRHEQRDTYFQKVPMKRRVDGLIIISLPPDDSETQMFARSEMPVVLVDCYNPHLTSIVVDNVRGAYEAVSHLLDLGRRRIGFVNGITEGNFRFNQANSRLRGYENALREHGIEFDPDLIVRSGWNRQSGYEAAYKLLSLECRPDAIFAASDLQALGALEAIRDKGMKVPDDIALIGYDGIELAELLNLSTMQQPMQEMGTLGVQLLLEKVQGKAEEKIQTLELPAKLISRATTLLST